MIKEGGISYDIGRIESIAENRTALSPGRFTESGISGKPSWKKVEPSEIHVSDDCQSFRNIWRNSIFRDSVCRTRKDWSWQGMTY